MKANHYLCLVFILVAALMAGTALGEERMAVKSKKANVRALPDKNSDTLWQIEKYHPVLIVEKRGQWFRLKDFEGDMGWIHSSLVDTTRTIIIRVNLANIRTGPGTQHNLAFEAGKGTPFKVLEEQQRWLKVQHDDGDVGWIFKTLIW